MTHLIWKTGPPGFDCSFGRDGPFGHVGLSVRFHHLSRGDAPGGDGGGWQRGSWGLKGPPRVRGDGEEGG